MTATKIVLSGLTLSLLAGCGGGGSGGGTVPLPGLIFHQIDSTTNTVVAVAGDQDGSEIEYGVLAGTLNEAGTQIALAGGAGVIDILPSTTEFVRPFEALVDGAPPVLGVYGSPIEAAELPTGRADYTGIARFVINDSTRRIDAEGVATVTARFVAKTVDMVFTEDGTAPMTGEIAGVDLDGGTMVTVGVLSILGAPITVSGFTGGTLTLSGSDLDALPIKDPIVSTSGGFFGPGADEVGGVIDINDSDFGALRIQGWFVAD